MIKSLLQRESNGSWSIDNAQLIEQIQETLKTCEQKCHEVASRNFSRQVGAQDFKEDLKILKGQIVNLSERLAGFSSTSFDDLDRKALTNAFVKTALSIQELKKKNANKSLFDEIDLVFVKSLTNDLDQLIGEVPDGYFSYHTKQLADDIRKLPSFAPFCDQLRKFKTKFSDTSTPSLAISFSFNDHEMASLVNELLKMATKNVHFFEDDGPKSGRAIGGFLQHLEKDDYIVVMGSSSYGEKARSCLPSGVKSEEQVIVERYKHNPKHVILLLIEGSVDLSFPSEMAHSQVGYLEATSANQLLPSIARVLERVYFYSERSELKLAIEEMKRGCCLVLPNPAALQETESSRLFNLETLQDGLKASPLLAVFQELYTCSDYSYLRRMDGQYAPLEKSYVELHFVQKKEHPLFSNQEKELGPPLENMKVSELSSIPLQALFATDEPEKPIHRLLIEGRAGSGKSTFLRYLTFIKANQRTDLLGDWALNYQLFVHVPLNEIDGSTLAEWIKKTFPEHFFSYKIEEIDKFLSSEKILFLFDAFDEVEENRKAVEWIKKELRNRSNWILVSKFGSVTDSLIDPIRKPCQKLVLTGFNPHSVRSFVDKFFSEGNAPKDFLIELERDPKLKSLAETPFILELLSHFWSSSNRDKITLSYLMIRSLLGFFNRYFRELSFASLEQIEEDKEAKACLHFYSLLAWNGLNENKKIFNDRDYSCFFTPQGLLKNSSLKKHDLFSQFGLLRVVGKDDKNPRCEFVHPLFQFLLAACVELEQISNQSELYRREKGELELNKFSVHYWLTAGILSYEKKIPLLCSFFSKLIPHPETASIEIVALAARCLEETDFNCNNKGYEQIKKGILNALDCHLSEASLQNPRNFELLQMQMEGCHSIYSLLIDKVTGGRPKLVEFLLIEVEKLLHKFEKSAFEGDANAQVVMGVFHLFFPKKTWGDFVEGINKASGYFKSASDLDNPTAMFFLSLFYFDGTFIPQDIKKSLDFLNKAACLGYAIAQNRLGVMYLKGYGVPQDTKRAAEYLEQAALNGDVMAQCNLGLMYMKGEGVDQNFSTAVNFFEKSAYQGDISALVNLGIIYNQGGEGVPQDMPRADHYFDQAAREGGVRCQITLGEMFVRGDRVVRDMEKAVKYYEMAASKDNPVALDHLGFIYSQGIPVSQDMSKAVLYFTKAASQGYAPAQYHLGAMYGEGIGIKKDIIKAAELIQKSASQGFPQAQDHLGVLYFKGEGIDQDKSKAAELFQKSASQGWTFAQFRLGLLYLEGDGVAKDKSKAAELFEKAASQGFAAAQYHLGVMHALGDGVAIDKSKAAGLFGQAASQGHVQSKDYLHILILKEISQSQRGNLLMDPPT